MKVRRAALALILGFFVSLAVFAQAGFASFEKDPIKSTQSDVVPVTEEFLNREGESGPASPSFKMSDTSKFFVKKPYQKAENEMKQAEEKASSAWWDNWFSWEDGDENSDQPQPVDEK